MLVLLAVLALVWGVRFVAADEAKRRKELGLTTTTRTGKK